MELISMLFLIGSSGHFLAFLLLLVDHPQKVKIGIFAVVILLILNKNPIAIRLSAIVSSPLIIFLDYKRINWKEGLVYVVLSFLIILLTYKVFIHVIPFYIFPVLMFGYVMVAKKSEIPKKEVK